MVWLSFPSLIAKFLQNIFLKMKTKQEFNIRLAQHLSLHGAITLHALEDLLPQHLHERDGTFYARLSSAEFADYAPYLSADEIRAALKHLHKEAYIAVLPDTDEPAYMLFALTDKARTLIAECSKKLRKRKQVIDVQALVAEYGFDAAEITAVVGWLDFRAANYGCAKTEQSVKVQCGWLRTLKEDDGLDIIKIIQYVMSSETWQNIKPDYIRNMLERQQQRS